MAAPAFSIGIGGSFGLDVAGGSVGPGVLLSLKLDDFPMVFGVGASFGGGVFQFGATIDWWLWHTNLGSIFGLYVGPGAYLSVGTAYFGVGLRIPIGLQAWIIDPLELFLEIAPTLGYGGGTFPRFGVQGAVGFRFWF